MKCSRFEGYVQQLSGRAERKEKRLSRRIADETAIAFLRRDGPAGFGRGLLDGRHLIASLDDAVSLPEGRFDVTEAELLVIVLVMIREGVAGVGLVHRHGAGLQSLLDVENVRQHLPADTDLCDRVMGRPLAVGNDCGHRLALVAHFIARNQRLIVEPKAHEAQQAC